MRLRYLVEYNNKKTIIFQGTSDEALPGIIANGLGGSKSDSRARGLGNYFTPNGSDEYVTRHLGMALDYAYTTLHVANNRRRNPKFANLVPKTVVPVVVALEWTNPGTDFGWDEDEDENSEDDYLKNRDREQYARSNYTAPKQNLTLLYAWELPINPLESIGIDLTKTWTTRPGTYHPPGTKVLDPSLVHASGETAIRWLDRYGKLVYNAYDRQS